jgi:hypothetical protein
MVTGGAPNPESCTETAGGDTVTRNSPLAPPASLQVTVIFAVVPTGAPFLTVTTPLELTVTSELSLFQVTDRLVASAGVKTGFRVVDRPATTRLSPVIQTLATSFVTFTLILA